MPDDRPDPPAHRAPGSNNLKPARTTFELSPRLASLLLGLFYFVLWHLTHRFRGLDHDGQLYALQALARLHPELYGNDIFFRFGSQDSFTIFTAIYAPFVKWLGLGLAAGLLTFVSTLGLFAAAWLLARRWSRPDLAWLSVGLLIVVELYYGGFDVFKTGEEFLTARLPAEALGLLALALAFTGRRIAAFATAVAALLIHPLMATPVIAVIVLMSLRPVHRWLAIGAGVMGLGILCWLAAAMPFGPLRVMDQEWLSIIRSRSYYLFLTSWPLSGWNRIAVEFVTLLLAIRLVSEPARTFFSSVAIVGCMGIALAFVSDLFPLQPLVQGQPWRWLWVFGVVSLLSIPLVVSLLWQRDDAGRTAAVLLGASWMLLDSTGSILAVGSSALVVWAHRFAPSARGLLRALRWGALGLVVLWMASGAFVMHEWDIGLGQEPAAIEALRTLFGFMPITISVATCGWYAVSRLPAKLGLPGAAACITITAYLMAGPAFVNWTGNASSSDGPSMAFSEWRRIIPPGTEVLWLWNPVDSWMLLQRPSYMSLSQSAGILFSRPLAAEIDRRVDLMHDLGDRDWLIVGGRAAKPPRPLSQQALEEVCRDPQLGFVVSENSLDGAVARLEWPRKGQYTHLYDCGRVRAQEVAS